MTSFYWLDAYIEDVFNSVDIEFNPENCESQGYIVNIDCASCFVCVSRNPSIYRVQSKCDSNSSIAIYSTMRRISIHSSNSVSVLLANDFNSI